MYKRIDRWIDRQLRAEVCTYLSTYVCIYTCGRRGRQSKQVSTGDETGFGLTRSKATKMQKRPGRLLYMGKGSSFMLVNKTVLLRVSSMLL